MKLIAAAASSFINQNDHHVSSPSNAHPLSQLTSFVRRVISFGWVIKYESRPANSHKSHPLKNDLQRDFALPPLPVPSTCWFSRFCVLFTSTSVYCYGNWKAEKFRRRNIALQSAEQQRAAPGTNLVYLLQCIRNKANSKAIAVEICWGATEDWVMHDDCWERLRALNANEASIWYFQSAFQDQLEGFELRFNELHHHPIFPSSFIAPLHVHEFALCRGLCNTSGHSLFRYDCDELINLQWSVLQAEAGMMYGWSFAKPFIATIYAQPLGGHERHKAKLPHTSNAVQLCSHYEVI